MRRQQGTRRFRVRQGKRGKGRRGGGEFQAIQRPQATGGRERGGDGATNNREALSYYGVTVREAEASNNFVPERGAHRQQGGDEDKGEQSRKWESQQGGGDQ